jgi:predicted nucleic acid-binding protein
VILVDTNVLLDVAADDSEWATWSASHLQAAALEGPLLINGVIYAELSVRYATIEALDDFVEQAGLEVVEIPKRAFFLAAKAFTGYRRAGGIRTGVLPDFFIGAHAAMMEIPLLTRDARKYRTYFPTVELRTPANPD